MVTIVTRGHTYDYELQNIAQVFLATDAFRIISADETMPKKGVVLYSSKLIEGSQVQVTTELRVDDQPKAYANELITMTQDDIMDKKAVKRTVVRQFYLSLKAIYEPLSKWGVLVGVRPTKLCHELMDQGLNDQEIYKILTESYFIEAEKVALLLEICHLERPYIYPVNEKKIALYLSIPFCPTRCLYCSFPAYAVSGREDAVKKYVVKLIEELVQTAPAVKDAKVDSLYFGGGTPATLSPEQISRIYEAIGQHYDLSEMREFTFEAGRPDAIDDCLLKTLKALGVDRVCVNPQTMDDRTLKLIGRKHNVEQTVRAMALVKHYGFKAVNMDLIIGLPEETLSDAKRSIESVLALKPENITIHTLAIKRSSRLNRERDEYELPNERLVEDMLSVVDREARKSGYVPYYMYRQKYMLGNLENVGYTLPEYASVYNMMIMEEKQTILAFGAGATSKFYYPSEDRFERVHNVKNLEDYFERVDEMVARKLAILNLSAPLDTLGSNR